jgi:predicted metal-binding membrane protein
MLSLDSVPDRRQPEWSKVATALARRFGDLREGTMAGSHTFPMDRERHLILGSLLALAAAAWALLLWQRAATDGGMGLTMGIGAPLFVAIWVVMIVATMFPAAAPIVLTFARVQKEKRQRGQPFVPTYVFVGAYLTVWGVFGVLAYGAAVAAERLADQSMWLMSNAPRFGGGVLMLAGLYQLSPLKRLCLTKCRTPMSFILGSWRDGYGGSFRMGLEHGLYCVGCCWLLMVILFPLGVMNVAAMALVTLLIFAEKSLTAGRQMGRLAALGLIGYGLLAMVVPGALPTMM